jgi:hypothetical protein
MLKSEAQLEAEIAALLRKAELIDAQEDARYGKGKRGDELPKELQRRQDRLDALRKAKAGLEAEAADDIARRREQQARAAEEQAAEEAADKPQTKAAQQSERRARSARGRAGLAHKLAVASAAVPGANYIGARLPNRRRTTATTSKEETVGSRVATARQRSMATTRSS